MIANSIFSFFIGLIALSLSSSVALHDTRLDKAFAGAVSPASDTALRDYGHAVNSELHVHSSHQTVTDAHDPSLTARSHKKHTTLHHARFKLSMLSA